MGTGTSFGFNVPTALAGTGSPLSASGVPAGTWSYFEPYDLNAGGGDQGFGNPFAPDLPPVPEPSGYGVAGAGVLFVAMIRRCRSLAGRGRSVAARSEVRRERDRAAARPAALQQRRAVHAEAGSRSSGQVVNLDTPGCSLRRSRFKTCPAMAFYP